MTRSSSSLSKTCSKKACGFKPQSKGKYCMIFLAKRIKEESKKSIQSIQSSYFSRTCTKTLKILANHSKYSTKTKSCISFMRENPNSSPKTNNFFPKAKRTSVFHKSRKLIKRGTLNNTTVHDFLDYIILLYLTVAILLISLFEINWQSRSFCIRLY